MQLVFISLLSTSAYSQTFTCVDTISDIDGNIYNTVQIAGQCWTHENLTAIRCSDGTAIPLVKDSTLWPGLSTPGFFSYNYDINNVDSFRQLYNGFTAMNPCGIKPGGWHIPSDSE